MTAAQLSSAIQATAAMAEAIRTVGEVPSGVLYANVCGQMDLGTFHAVIGLLKRSQLVAESNHVLTWVGPVIAKEVV